MVFSSFLFIFLFLPITCIVYFLVPTKLRNYVLLLASIIFYGWGAPNMIALVIVSCGVDYWVSKRLVPEAHNKRWNLLVLIVGIDLALLGYYKYANFFISEFNQILTGLTIAGIPWANIALPVGISFFTFQKISYLVDVYRGDTKPARGLSDYILYVLLFPQLIAGPIVRYSDVASEIVNRTSSIDGFLAGLFRFSVGLGKKVLIADAMGTVADNVFGFAPGTLNTSWAWIGIVAYSFQIYFDFSGYSDMAIGLGWMFGFHFKENFNRPYLATTITEFWRRWHISLSSFMREYLYYPLGGSKGSSWKTYRNLWLVFLLSGLWHGAAWNFIVWGAFHGLFLVLDRIVWGKVAKRLPTLINVAITFIIVAFGWVLFRAPSLSSSLQYMATLIGIASPTEQLLVPEGFIIDNRSIVMMMVAALFSFVPALKIEPIRINVPKSAVGLTTYAVSILVLLIFSAAFFTSRGYTPFLYFRF